MYYRVKTNRYMMWISGQSVIACSLYYTGLFVRIDASVHCYVSTAEIWADISSCLIVVGCYHYIDGCRHIIAL